MECSFFPENLPYFDSELFNYRCNVSMARRAIRDLESKGIIRPISKHASQCIYTRALAAKE